MTNEKRLEIELDIVGRYVQAMLDAGFTIGWVNYGEGWEADQGRRISDEERIQFLKDGAHKQWLYFVYGNEPGEVLCDYTTGCEEAIAEVNAYAEQWA